MRLNINDVVLVGLTTGERLAVITSKFAQGERLFFRAHYIDTTTGDLEECDRPGNKSPCCSCCGCALSVYTGGGARKLTPAEADHYFNEGMISRPIYTMAKSQ